MLSMMGMLMVMMMGSGCKEGKTAWEEVAGER